MAAAVIPYWRLSAFYFFYFAMLGTWLPFWSLYLQELGYSATEIGYISAVVMATKIFAPSLWGYLAAKTQKRIAIIRLGSAIAFFVFLAIFWRTDFWWMVAVVAGYSFFWNAVLAQFEVVTLSHLQDQYERYSQIRVWGSVGFIIAVVGFGAFLQHMGMGYVPMLAAGLLALIWLSSLIISERKLVYSKDSRRGIGEILRSPTVISFYLACFLLQVAHGPYYTFFSIYLEQLGYSTAVIGLLWSLGVVAEVLLFMVMHKIMAAYSLRDILLLSLLLTVARWLMIGYMADSLLALLIAQCLHAASFGSFHAVAVELIRRMFGEHQGQGMALYSGLSFGAGGAIGAVASGWLWVHNQSLTFALASVASLIALIICYFFITSSSLIVVKAGAKV